MQFNFDNFSYLAIFGTAKGGKSNFLKHLMHQLYQAGWRYIIFDWVHDYDEDFGQIVTNLEALIRYAGYRRLIYQYPGTPSKEATEAFFSLIWNDTRFWNYFIVMEEADQYIYSRSSKTSSAMSVINLGRHHGNGYAVVSRRLGDLNLDASAYADYIISFLQYLDKDLQRLADILGKDIAREVRNLEPYHFILVNIKSQNLVRGEKWDIHAPVPLME